MMKLTKSLSTGIAILASATMLSVFVPAATAVGQGNGAVASARSFRVQAPRKNLLQESVSTTVDGSSPWTLTSFKTDVPKTQSPAEKTADEAARAAAQRQAEQAAAAAQQAAASRSEERQPITNSAPAATSYNPPAPNSATASGVVGYANSFVGHVPYVYGGNDTKGWDCSGFVKYVFASIGINLPRTSGAQAMVGSSVSDINAAQPGDIIANGMHAGIYIGNGMVVNALNESAGTALTPVSVAFTGGYSIRRVL